MSSVMSNVATVAIMMPVVASACYASHGKLLKKHTFMAIGIAACMGGSLTLIGAPTNMLGSGFLESAGEAPLTLFSFTPLGVIRVIVCIIFYATIGYNLQQKVFDFEEEIPQLPESDQDAPKKTPKEIAKMWTSFGILVLMVVGFITKIWPMPAVAMTCGMLTVITGCIPMNTAFKKLPWECYLGCSWRLWSGCRHGQERRWRADRHDSHWLAWRKSQLDGDDGCLYAADPRDVQHHVCHWPRFHPMPDRNHHVSKARLQP